MVDATATAGDDSVDLVCRGRKFDFIAATYCGIAGGNAGDNDAARSSVVQTPTFWRYTMSKGIEDPGGAMRTHAPAAAAGTYLLHCQPCHCCVKQSRLGGAKGCCRQRGSAVFACEQDTYLQLQYVQARTKECP